jgi:signal transduction histidine kinase
MEKDSHFELIYDALLEPVVLISERFELKELNKAAHAFSDPDKSNSQKCYEKLYGRDDFCPYCPLQSLKKNPNLNPANFFHRGSIEITILHKKMDKNEPFQLFFIPIEGEKGDFHILEIIRNISKQREKEDETLRMRNLASLGIMVSGVAHELNNPLTGINMTLQNLRKDIDLNSNPQIWDKLLDIEKDLKRASSIVTEIIGFAKPKKINKIFSEIHKTIQSAKENIERLFPKLCEHIEWQITRETESLSFYFDPGKLETLFINLFRNSIQAIDYKKGKISIEIKRKKNNNIQIVVEDDGGGIPEDVIAKIFDPFFSNRSDGSGTGLGLSIAHSIVTEHAGKINVKSYENKTRFIISLPMEA